LWLGLGNGDFNDDCLAVRDERPLIAGQRSEE